MGNLISGSDRAGKWSTNENIRKAVKQEENSAKKKKKVSSKGKIFALFLASIPHVEFPGTWRSRFVLALLSTALSPIKDKEWHTKKQNNTAAYLHEGFQPWPRVSHRLFVLCQTRGGGAFPLTQALRTANNGLQILKFWVPSTQHNPWAFGKKGTKSS